MDGRSRGRWVGAVGLALAVTLWAVFALSIRGIGGSGLTALDAALLRFGVPVVVLAAWLPRAVRAVRSERPAVLATVSLAGLPHYLVSEVGGSWTSAALVGLLIPGSVPFFVALVLFCWRRERPSGRRLAGLTAIVVGIGATALLTSAGATTVGVGALLAAGLLWAVYTLALRDSGLDLTSLVLWICVPSFLLAAVLGVSGAMPSHLMTGSAPLGAVGLYAALQGLGTGIVSTVAYAAAVRQLGGTLSSAVGALSPVLVAVAAVPLFEEPVTAGLVMALLLIVGGVLAFHAPARRPMLEVSAAPSRRSRPDPVVTTRSVAASVHSGVRPS